ncbi:hypothetical protein [Fictibacillus phosphorivorans]|uniref:hypothetical protein n=1 Tax=Fictibacillus phosphorivorans TaxID=1221500 RepID=UPI00203EBD51|nr:hypothetical protein [Fictibacillus phosphorivorans]MCM3717556.1 hypothetical protein [Fictibacillus phosphorivorans]MCM3775251.1 hypothetical protein [Fictibacillus phosphorivorans]
MMLFIFLCLITAGLLIETVQKRILKIKDPDIKELWEELEKRTWYEELIQDPHLKEWVVLDKQNGLLKDPYYVRKVLESEGHRLGFINYIKNKAN